MDDIGQLRPDDEVHDADDGTVAGRFRAVGDAEQVIDRLNELGISGRIEERTGIHRHGANLWVWVPTKDIEQARTCMRPADVLGAPTPRLPAEVEEAITPAKEKKGLFSKFLK